MEDRYLVLANLPPLEDIKEWMPENEKEEQLPAMEYLVYDQVPGPGVVLFEHHFEVNQDLGFGPDIDGIPCFFNYIRTYGDQGYFIFELVTMDAPDVEGNLRVFLNDAPWHELSDDVVHRFFSRHFHDSDHLVPLLNLTDSLDETESLLVNAMERTYAHAHPG